MARFLILCLAILGLFHGASSIASPSTAEVSPRLADLFKSGNAETVDVFDITQPPTAAPTLEPTATPSAGPTFNPTVAPSPSPSAVPTVAPTPSPSAVPTFAPTFAPSHSPSAVPTKAPTFTPSAIPTAAPSFRPTATPTIAPSRAPTLIPTRAPTTLKPQFSNVPTAYPTASVYPVLSFDASFAVNNVFDKKLSQNGIYAIRVTISQVAKVDVTNVEYLGFTLTTRRFLTVANESYNLIVNSRITVPLVEYPQYNSNTTLAYLSTVNNINTAIAATTFTNTLQQHAYTFVAYEFLQSQVTTPATVSSLDVNEYTYSSDDSALTDGQIAGIVLGVFFGLLLLLLAVYFLDQYMRQRAASKQETTEGQAPAMMYVAHTDPNNLRPYSEDEVVISIEETSAQELDDVAKKTTEMTTQRYVYAEGNDVDTSQELTVNSKVPVELNL